MSNSRRVKTSKTIRLISERNAVKIGGLPSNSLKLRREPDEYFNPPPDLRDKPELRKPTLPRVKWLERPDP